MASSNIELLFKQNCQTVIENSKLESEIIHQHIRTCKTVMTHFYLTPFSTPKLKDALLTALIFHFLSAWVHVATIV